MLLSGINHVATLTSDTDRLHAFYREVFDAVVVIDDRAPAEGEGFRMSIVDIGDGTMLNVFDIRGNTEAARQVPMFGRGRIDHLALQASSRESFDRIRQRLMAAGATDGFVTDFGEAYSVFFRDPDGLDNPDSTPGTHNPPGTRAARFT